jgi:hypothetical protein
MSTVSSSFQSFHFSGSAMGFAQAFCSIMIGLTAPKATQRRKISLSKGPVVMHLNPVTSLPQ